LPLFGALAFASSNIPNSPAAALGPASFYLLSPEAVQLTGPPLIFAMVK
jgi:hypothetical protein